MPQLKVTLKLESLNLFPSPYSQTTTHNLDMNGTFMGFNKMTLSVTPIQINTAPINGPSLSAYIYIAAPNTNLQTVFIRKNSETEPFLKLLPGDVAFFPYGGQLSVDDLVAYTAGAGAAEILYFIGEKD
jgi:hypothetical protein